MHLHGSSVEPCPVFPLLRHIDIRNERRHPARQMPQVLKSYRGLNRSNGRPQNLAS